MRFLTPSASVMMREISTARAGRATQRERRFEFRPSPRPFVKHHCRRLAPGHQAVDAECHQPGPDEGKADKLRPRKGFG